jgi:ABC-type amino acid transport substrate-binding protein
MNALSALFLVLLNLSRPSLAAQPPLEIAAEDDAEPWSQRDGSGYANDVVQAAFRAAGVKTRLTVLPYARCKDYVLRGKLVAGFSMSWLPDFKDKLVFSKEPLFSCHSDYFFQGGQAPKASRAAGLPTGTVVGVVIGYEYPPSVYDLRSRGVLAFEESESEELNLKKLALGRIDTALINYNETKPAELMMANAGVSGKVKRGFSSGTLGSYIGFSLLHPRGAWAKRKFDQGYAAIAANGTLAKISARWVAKAREKTASVTEKTHGPQ